MPQLIRSSFESDVGKEFSQGVYKEIKIHCSG